MNEKGFTLIELLAVIVILAVIALIATPIIMNVINDSKKGSAKDAMYGYVKAVELASAKLVTATSNAPTGTYRVTNGNLVMKTETLTINFKGNKPKDGGSVTLSNGQVLDAGLEFDSFCIKYDGSKAMVGDNCEMQAIYTEGDIVYYNPETNKKCTSEEVNKAGNAKTGCMSWNIITVGDTASKPTVDMILNHNTTAILPWNSTGTNKEMKEVATALQKDVASWNATVKSTARLITGQEVADIAKDTSWTPGGKFIPLSNQSWLYQNTKNNGDNTNNGYWTSTAYSPNSVFAWLIYYNNAGLYYAHVEDTVNFGVRPVITISKSVIA